MSKRKSIPGGYQDSSDLSDGERQLRNIPLGQGSTKKVKSTPHPLPRLSTSNLRATSFQHPGTNVPRGLASSSPIVLTSSERNTSTPEPISSFTNSLASRSKVPGLPRRQADDLPSSESEIAIRTSDVGQNDVGRRVSASQTTDTTTVLSMSAASQIRSILGRSVISLERRIDEVITSLDDCRQANADHYKRTHEQLTSLFDAVAAIGPPAPAPPKELALVRVPGTNSTTVKFVNPKPTLETVNMVSEVVGETRSRVGTRNKGLKDNALNEFIRGSFYRTCDIGAAKSIRPFFLDEHGQVDTLPAQFVDPDTGYCTPHPDWESPLTKQVAWVPTWLHIARGTVPQGDVELVEKVANLSDKQMITLMHDGPFRTCQAAWRNLKKTPEELEEMRSEARRYQRTERKCLVIGSYVKSIPALQGPECEYLYNPGYVSQEESDGEGVLITKRPKYRAQWVRNFSDAVQMAELKRTSSRAGVPRPERRVVLVDSPIPALEQGTGGKKVTLRIPLCSLRESWLHKNAKEFQKYAHLVDMKITNKPNIDDFLAQHPLVPEGEIAETPSDLANPTQAAVVDNLVSALAGNAHAESQEEFEADDEDSDVDEQDGGFSGFADSSNNADVIPIDPALRDEGALNPATPDVASTHNAEPTRFPSVVNYGHGYQPAHQVQMPPPPPLVDASASKPTTPSDQPLPKKRGRRPKNSVGGGAPSDAARPETQAEVTGATQTTETPQPKKRGRPSKQTPLVEATPTASGSGTTQTDEEGWVVVETTQPKKRGRPLGSKNKVRA